MTQLIKNYFVLLLFVQMILVVKPLPPPNAEQKEYLTQMQDSMSKMVEILSRIHSTMNPKFPKVCTKPLENLVNIDTDWNPKATYAHGDKVRLSCKKGYMTESKKTEQMVTCLLGDSWTIHEHCLEKKPCENSMKNLVKSRAEWIADKIYYQDDTVTITCNKGLKTEADVIQQTATCLGDASWSSIQPCSVQRCPDPFTKHGTICIYINKHKSNWDVAKESCEKMAPELGSSLAVLKTRDEQADLADYTKKADFQSISWIGVNDKVTEGSNVWLDNTPFIPYEKFPWNSGEVGNLDESEDCFAFGNGKLYDEYCSADRSSFCMILFN